MLKKIKNYEKKLISKYGYKKYRKKIISKKKNFEIIFDHGLEIFGIRNLNSKDGFQMIEGPLKRIIEQLEWPDDIEFIQERR